MEAPTPAARYDIHTSFSARLPPYSNDSRAGGGNGADAWGVRRRTPGKRGVFLYERLVAHGGKGVSVRGLGGDRAGEMRITRFLHNPKVTIDEMMGTARARACAQVAGRHVLAIQDTSALRVDEKGLGLSFDPVKTKGFDVEALRQEEDGPLEKLVAAILIAAVKVMQLVDQRDGKAKRPLSDVVDPDDQPALKRVGQSLEGKTAKQKNPHPPGSLAYAALVFARLGGWTGYYDKPGPIVMLRGLTQFPAIKHGWSLRNV